MSYLKEEMLVKVSTENNNNKFYHVALTESNQIITRWGRVGSEGTEKTQNGTERQFTSIVNSKKSRGYRPTNIITSQSDKKDKLATAAKKNLLAEEDKTNTLLEKLIEKLVRMNTHEILRTSGGLIKVQDGIIRTPLGLVDIEAICEAKKILNDIPNIKNNTPLIEEYLTLIPQKVNRSQWETFLSTPDSISKQEEFLKQLKNSITLHQKTLKTSQPDDEEEETYEDLFKTKISILDPSSREWRRIEKLYESTRNRVHHANALHVKNIYVLRNHEEEERYQEAQRTVGNEMELWHGTRAYNILSILHKGLFIPKPSDNIHITGRMFGDGIYFSDQSTKALNYSYGYWSGRSQDSNCFMFLADTATGNQFRPKYFDQSSLQKAHHGKNRFGRKFDSIHVKGGTCGVMNNETIIWNANQINLKYLVEFEK